MNKLIDFSGHFHPVLVHLPIGFLLLAIIFQWMSAKEKFVQLQTAVRISYLLGAVSAVFSCLTGLALSSGGEYDASTLQFHQWFGIAVAVVSLIAYWFSKKPFTLYLKILSLLIFVLIIITGHLGGTLTHGEGFLTQGLNTDEENKTVKKPIANVQEAVIYSDIIQPVLIEKCGSCHSARKQKGGLRVDASEWIIKGGKNGQVYTPGNADASELYKRIVLDPLEEKHMPPKGKPQLTASEINLLHWWINSQAGFDKKTKDVAQPASIESILKTLQNTSVQKSDMPEKPVEQAPQSVIDELRKAGIAVSPVAGNSNYLQASFVIAPKPDNTLLDNLSSISKQLIWLKMPGVKLPVDGWKVVAGCKSLTRLSLEHSNITDTTIALLNSLQQLQYLNLVGTNLTIQGMQQLKGFPELGQLYLGQTRIKQNDFASVQKVFPKTIIDSGNYKVSTLVTDTQMLKAPPVKK